MPKKSGRCVRESRIGKRINEAGKATSEDVVVNKKFRSFHINVKIAKRWFYVKKRLEFTTDDELATYLLDLAEPIVRRDGRCAEAGDWKTDKDKENDSEVVKTDDKDSPVVEEPLRRSPRKQMVVTEEPVEAAEEIPKTVLPIELEVAAPRLPELPEKRKSRVKHHKTKGKHHRDKRGRRKHSKNIDEKNSNSINDETSVISRINDKTEESTKIVVKQRNNSLDSIAIKSIVERLSLVDDNAGSCEKSDVSNDKKNSNTTEIVENSDNSKNSPIIGINENPNKNDDSPSKKSSPTLETTSESSTITNDPKILEENSEKKLSPNNSHEKTIILPENNESDPKIPTTESRIKLTIDDKKTKKKRKHAKQDSSMENEITSDLTTNETNHKRHKKKHKYPTLHKKRKYHDVRKAPQDGRAAGLDDLESPELDIILPETISIQNPEKPPEIDVSTIIGEPQRLAIKIKLCSDCNDRHLEDACPLDSTEYAIKDAITREEWLKTHKNNSDVAKATNSDDPMAEGYAIFNDEAEESDDDNATGEHYKIKTKIDVEEKQLHVNVERPLYSRDSLPNCFEFKMTNGEHGIGVYAKKSLPMYAKLGPLVGCPVKEMDIPDDFTMRHIWEIDDNGKTSYISTTNPLRSNWIRYMRPADTKDEKNVAVVTNNGELHLVTTRNITTGMELTYWADSQSSTWTRKNKTEKTNCGGCNLNFTHPIYYRLHCCIFHDTNYSLTIRKYHCKICGDAVLGKDNIMKHAADLHGGRGAYQCQFCRKFFLRLNYLEMHRTYGCSQNPQRSRPLCDFCGRKFCQPQKLKVHIKRMHSDMSEVLREFQCKLCLKLLGSRAALQRHMKEVHHKDVVAAATCDRCGKMFQNKSNLKIHMLTHSGVKPFKCKEKDCKAAFTTKQCLQFHYKKVHGLTEEMMPKIERSVAYTFDAYSGGLVEASRGHTSRSGRRGSQDNSNGAMSMDDCSSEHSSRADASISSFQATINEFDNDVVATSTTSNADREPQDYPILERESRPDEMNDRESHDRNLQRHDMEKRDFNDHEMQNRDLNDHELQNRDFNDHELQNRDLNDHEMQNRDLNDRELQNHDLNDRELQNHDLRDNELQNHDLRVYELQNHDLKDHERKNHDLQDRELQNHDLHDRELQNHDLHDRELQNHDLHDRELQNHNLHDRELQNHDLHDRELQNHDLHDRELQNHDLRDRELQNHDLHDRELQNHDLRDRELQNHDLRDHELQNHDLKDREMKNRDLHDRELQNHDFHDHKLQNRDFHDHELQNRDFHDHELQNRDLHDHELRDHELRDHELQNRDSHDHHPRNRDLRDDDMENNSMRDREISESPPPPSHQDMQMSSSTVSPLDNLRPSPDVDFYGISRLPSKGSKKWMGEFNPPADPEIVHQNSLPTSREIYEFDENVKKDETRNDGVTSSLINGGNKLGLNIYRRPESTNASLLVEAALDAAERDIGAVSSPMLDDNDRDGNLYSISSQLQSPLPSRSSDNHMDSYIHQQDELMSTSTSPEARKTPSGHVQMDYHLHRPIDYINSPRTHNIEQYLPQDELPRVSSPTGYILPQDELPSPTSTPNSNRYPGIHHHHHHHHHQVPTDNLSSDEGDSVAQNLSLSVKEKSLQLDLSTTYKYDSLDAEFCRERTNFEPLVLNSGELQGLDMSARGFHHGLGQQLPNNRYHHHLYEITERQTVDLSRTSGYSISPPPPPYPHSEVLRIVSLDLTPSHSVDLSLSRSHHLHAAGNRVIGNDRVQIVTGNSQNSGTSNSHVVPDALEGRILSPPPPPSLSGYNATYPVSPAPYHPPRPGYHHYSGYY